MIRSLQKKFVLTAMIAVTVLLLVVLGALNIFNMVSNTRQAELLIEDLGMRLNRMPLEGIGPEPILPDSGQLFHDSFTSPMPEEPGFRNRRRFLDEPMDEDTRLSAVYFCVDLNGQCEIIRTDVSHVASVSEEDAARMALSLDVDQDSGTVDSFRYKIFSFPDGGYRVVFLDNAIRRSSVLRVALLSLLLGLMSWLLMLALVILLSRKAIRPIAENMQRQRQFVTDAGHDLKTPLAIILANVDAMELRSGETKYSRNIRTQAGRLSELMKNLLSLARMDEMSLQEHAEQLDFSRLCEESFDMFRPGAELKNISFRLDCKPGIMLRGDRSLLSQLCSILGDNAIKYCPEEGSIDIHLSHDGRGCCLRVTNSVAELPDLERIFDRFYRSDSSRNQKEGGFGIGLSAAQEIARLHKARLSAEAVGESSLSFVVRFP